MPSVSAEYQSQSSLKQKLKTKPTVVNVGRIDYTTLVVVIILVCIGVIMVFSAGYYKTAVSQAYNYDEYYFLKRQLTFAVGGFVIMAVTCRIFKYLRLIKLSPLMYLGANALVALVPIIGEEVNGAKRWIKVPIVGQFQPSELVKAAIIFMLAYLIHKNKNMLKSGLGFIICCALIGGSALLVLLGNRNLSTSIIIAILGMGIVFIASPHFWRFIFMGIAGALAAVGYIMFSPTNFRAERIDAWLNPFDHPQGIGYQIIQSLYAIASGGPFGLGVGQSRQKSFLPEPHNDYIFSIICEELGIVGASLIIFLFAVLIWRGISIAAKAPDIFSSLVASGIVLLIGSQAIINIAVVTNSMPSTGIPLPFVSYGGTSLMIMMFLMGVLLNISKYSKE